RVSQVQGSPHRLPVPCDRSTTPLSWGRRGGLGATPTSAPSSHNSRSVGRSPRVPHGAPLSTRNRSGRPQRPKASRSCARVAGGGTWPKGPGGETRGPQSRAATLVNDPQPGDESTGAQLHQLGRVHLPDLVGPLRPARVGGGPAPRRRRGQAGAA